MSDNDRLDYHLLSDDEVAALQDRDIIRLRPQELPGRRRGGMPLTIQWEIEVAAGERAKALGRVQATAMRDVLSWVASRNAEQNQ